VTQACRGERRRRPAFAASTIPIGTPPE